MARKPCINLYPRTCILLLSRHVSDTVTQHPQVQEYPDDLETLLCFLFQGSCSALVAQCCASMEGCEGCSNTFAEERGTFTSRSDGMVLVQASPEPDRPRRRHRRHRSSKDGSKHKRHRRHRSSRAEPSLSPEPEPQEAHPEQSTRCFCLPTYATPPPPLPATHDAS